MLSFDNVKVKVQLPEGGRCTRVWPFGGKGGSFKNFILQSGVTHDTFHVY